MSRFKQGIYEVKNKGKYLGTKDPRYLSSWEFSAFTVFDNNVHVIKWGAEIVVIDYYSIVDQRKRRYMVDIYVEYLKGGKVVKELIEIKPYKETKPPKKGGRKKKETYLREVYNYSVNTAKWKFAAAYAKERGWKFTIMTEKELFR
jgi:hypothetical protein